jgi:hypothetical protein
MVDGFPSTAVPHDRGFALVGDPDGRHVAGRRSYLRQSLLGDCDLRRSDLFGSVLDPPGLRKDLIEFALGKRANRSFLIEQQSSRTGRALVER